MSVELSGPAGYDKQYQASALMGLLLLGDGGVLVIEPADGEDATLRWFSQNTTELQSKAGKPPVTPEVLAQWLLHFPSTETSGSLLERMVRDSSRCAVFTCGGRCSDSLGPFASTWAHAQQPLDDLDATIVRTMRAALIQQASDLATSTSTRARLRGASVGTWLAGLPASEIQGALQRVRVIENVEQAELEERIRMRLVQRYKVANSRADGCARAIDEAIRRARNSRADAWPAIRRVLLEFQNTPAFRPDQLERHVVRPDEAELSRRLRERHVLLLTGLSGCGKTWTAKRLAECLREEGFGFHEAPDFREIHRVLNAADNDGRVLHVDDPDEFVEPRGLRRLQDAINTVLSHRLLIVTASVDVLEKIYGSSDLSAWSTSGVQWVDLTVRDPEFLRRAWRATRCEDPEAERLLEVLIAGGSIPQPRVLDDLRHRRAGVLESIAASSGAGSAYLRGQVSVRACELASVIAFGADQLTRMPMEAMTWLLSNDSTQPGRLPDQPWRSSVSDAPPPLFPDWPTSLVPEWVEQARQELEEKGWIEVDERGVRFVHPRFVEAASAILGGESRWLALAARAVASLHPQGALIALKRLEDALKANLVGERWIGVAVNALHSLFPRVRDAAALMLGRHFSNLPADAIKELFQAVHRSRQDGSELLFHDNDPGTPWWIRDEPWLDPRIERGFSDRLLERLSWPEPEALASLQNAQAMQQPRLAYKLIQAAVLGKVDLSAAEIEQLMAAPERFVREEAARARLLKEPPVGEELLDTIFRDHPAVVAMALHAFFIRATDLDPSIIATWSDRFSRALESPIIALASLFVMENLEDALRHGRLLQIDALAPAHWRLWAQLASHWMRGMPPDLYRVRQGRLWSTARGALSHLSPEDVVRVADAWLGFLERCNEQDIDSYGLGVVEFLFHGSDAVTRGERLDGLLSHRIRQLRWVALGEALVHWDQLSASEQLTVRNSALSGGSSERVWQELTVFDSTKRADLCDAVFGNPMIGAVSAAELITSVPADVLAAGLRQHFGLQVPGDPNWNVPHDHARWIAIVEALLEVPRHPAYVLAVDALLSRQSLTDGSTAWARCLAAAGATGLDLLSQRLLCWSVLVTNCHLAGAWEQWWEVADEAARERALFAVAADIEAISAASENRYVLPRVMLASVLRCLASPNFSPR